MKKLSDTDNDFIRSGGGGMKTYDIVRGGGGRGFKITVKLITLYLHSP